MYYILAFFVGYIVIGALFCAALWHKWDLKNNSDEIYGVIITWPFLTIIMIGLVWPARACIWAYHKIRGEK